MVGTGILFLCSLATLFHGGTTNSYQTDEKDFDLFEKLYSGLESHPTFRELFKTCGVADDVGYSLKRPKTNQCSLLKNSRWDKNHLTYKIYNYSQVLSEFEVEYEIEMAFQMWSDVTPLIFTLTTDDPDIRIYFQDREDGYPYRKNEAQGPLEGGDIYISQKDWRIKTNNEYNLRQMATHLIGHSLGLGHNTNNDSVMNFNVGHYKENFTLNTDDISAIQFLYGKKNTEVSLCNDEPIDAIMKQPGDGLFVFKGSYVWKICNGVVDGFPKRIYDVFWGLPSNIDAAVRWSDGKFYFFKGSKFWTFTEFVLDEGNPKSIAEGFPGIPNNLDGVFFWSGNGVPYFFKYRAYYRFNIDKDPHVSSEYPADVNAWDKILFEIDDAILHDGATFFFKGSSIWRYNDKGKKVHPSYPRSAGLFLDCKDEGKNS